MPLPIIPSAPIDPAVSMEDLLASRAHAVACHATVIGALAPDLDRQLESVVAALDARIAELT